MNRAERAEYAGRIRERFYELKRDEGWTQETFAEEADASPRAVSALLRSESVPNEETLHKYARAVGIEVDAAAVRAQWVKYSRLFNLLYLYLESRPPEEHGAIRLRIYDALGLDDPNGIA